MLIFYDSLVEKINLLPNQGCFDRISRSIYYRHGNTNI